MNLQSLIDELERRWPHTLRCAWDNDGWMVCHDPEAPVRRVMLALDATAAAIGAAEEAGCELLLTHHPLLFRPLSSLTPQSLSGRRTLAALAAGADTLVTGEVGYNAALDAAEAGLMILEAGHYFTEAPVLETLAEVCRGTADAACVFYDSNLSAVL